MDNAKLRSDIIIYNISKAIEKKTITVTTDINRTMLGTLQHVS